MREKEVSASILKDPWMSISGGVLTSLRNRGLVHGGYGSPKDFILWTFSITV